MSEGLDVLLLELWVHRPVVLVSSGEVSAFVVARVSVKIVSLPLLWVTQDLVGGGELLKIRSRFRVVWVLVRVKLKR